MNLWIGASAHNCVRLNSSRSSGRGKAKRADYILYYKPNIPLAVIEAKDNNCSVGDGIQQALEYAQILQLPFVFSSNGDGFVFHDKTVTTGEIERTLPLDQFPTPAALWACYQKWKGLPRSVLRDGVPRGKPLGAEHAWGGPASGEAGRRSGREEELELTSDRPGTRCN